MKVIRFETRDSLHALNLITFIATTRGISPKLITLLICAIDHGIKTAENPAHF